MTKESKEDIRNNIWEKTIILSRRDRLRDHFKNRKNKIIITDLYSIREIENYKRISKRNN